MCGVSVAVRVSWTQASKMEAVALRMAASCTGMAGVATCNDECRRDSWTTCCPSSIRRQEIFGAKLSSKPRQSLSLARSLRKPSSVKAARVLTSNDDVFQDSCLVSTLDSPVRNGKHVERWVEECVHEIVRNIQEAPFLQYVFDNKGRLGRTNRQKVSQDLFDNADYWPGIQLTLSEASPDGLIFVQKLDPASPVNCPWAEASSSTDVKGEPPRCPLQAEGETCVWGVLVQAKGVNRNACYLLKTTRLCSSFGICATRYSLTKAKCFGPSQIEQLESAWLL